MGNNLKFTSVRLELLLKTMGGENGKTEAAGGEGGRHHYGYHSMLHNYFLANRNGNGMGLAKLI